VSNWLYISRVVDDGYFSGSVLIAQGETAVRHGIQPGMTILDIGPGNGTYTIAAARRVGLDEKVFAIDIEPRMIERVRQISGLLQPSEASL